MKTTLVIPDASASPAAYRRYARDWLGALLPAQMLADSIDYRTPTLDECPD